MSRSARGRRRSQTGVVVSSAMDKTIVVEVTRARAHPVYGKIVRRKRRFKAHDEEGQARPGDRVRIMETRPLSKTKRWRLVDVLEKAQ